MKKFVVHLETGASCSIEVDAEDEDDAVDQAIYLAPSGVCAQCSGWNERWALGIGEWDVSVFEPVTEVES